MENDPRRLDINTGDNAGRRLSALYDAIDRAADQDTRTVLTASGKVIAAIVTAEELGQLEALDPLRPRPSAPSLDAALASVLDGLEGGEPIVMRVEHAKSAVQRLRRQLASAQSAREQEILARHAPPRRVQPADASADAEGYTPDESRPDVIRRLAILFSALSDCDAGLRDALTEVAPGLGSSESIEEWLRCG